MDTFWGQAVSVYTREQALADGVLVDLSPVACGYGFRIPVACTAAVLQAIAWSEATESAKPHATGQTTEGRLHDVLTMAMLNAQAAAQAGESEVAFDVLMVPAKGQSTRPVLVSMWMAVGGGDRGEPVLTLMLAGED